MLRFDLHEFHLGRHHYVLLPKLNTAQMEKLAERLEGVGFEASLSASLVCRSKTQTIHIEPSGLCWSRGDTSDAVLPAVPELLSTPKERAPLESLLGMYFAAVNGGRSGVIRLRTRIESSGQWDSLRAAGECGLAPDEHAVASYLIQRIHGPIVLLTDFLGNDSASRLYGRKRYFATKLDSAEASSTLSMSGKQARRNSYIPRGGRLTLPSKSRPSEEGLRELFASLGEWCYFTPE